MADYNISGLQPTQTGGEWEHGDSWFLFDKSGTFSVDKDIKARIYLVGGGDNGESGQADSVRMWAIGGTGGDGGCVYTVSCITIPKNAKCNTVIADVGVASGTTIDISGELLSCDADGYISKNGGVGARVQHNSDNGGWYSTSRSSKGTDGVYTPYGYVGSSGGGGGASCSKSVDRSIGGSGAGAGGSFSNGGNAIYYGCGGGGGYAYINTNSTARPQTFSGGKGQSGCVIVCVISDVEIPPVPNLTYNGLVQYPFGENGIKGVVITGDLSAITTGKYTSFLNLESDDLCWSDGTQREIKIEWEIKPLVVPKPTLSQYEYDYNGSAVYDGTLYKLPSIEWDYDSPNIARDNIMDIDGTGTVQQYKAGTYPVTFILKHPDSCSWSDNTTDDFTLDWVINKIIVPTPEITSEDFTYSGQSYGINQTAPERKVVVENYDPKIMMQTGHTGNYSGAGNHYLTYTLRDPDSCSWEDESVTAKTVYWNILKQDVYLDLPYLEDDQKEFTYDGTSHTPVITNRDNNKMTVTGTLSSVAANKADNPFWKINIALKIAANYIYKWNVEDKDKQTEDVVLEWVVKKGRFKVPTVSPVHTPFNGKTQSVSVSGYNSNVMTYTGNTSGKTAGKYDIAYALKDRDSAEWESEDGNVTTENQTVSWWIDVARVPVPLVSDTEKRVSWYTSGNSVYLNSQSPTIEGYDTYLMSKSGDAGKYPNDYTLRFCLLDTESSTWDDEEYTTDCKEFPWVIKKEVVYYPKPYLNPEYPQFDYDGKTHTVTLKNYSNAYSSGNYTYNRKYNQNALRYLTTNKSGVKAGDYVITVEVCENSIFDFQWNDGTKDPVELNWTINTSTFPKPDISSRVYKFTNKNISITEINYNNNVMERTSSSVITAKNDGDYSITYRLKDKESASWDDGTTDDITIPWKIVALIDDADAVEVPVVTDTEFVYNGNRHAPTISEYDANLIGIRTTSTTSAINANIYAITFYLKAPNSSCWKDGTIEDKRFAWTIKKAIQKFENPTLDPNAVEFLYNGLGQRPTVLGVNSTVMTVNNPYIAEAGEYTVTVSLKTHQNYEYQWMDGTTNSVELGWKINKITAIIPTISQDLFYYGAYTSGYHFISHAWRQPEIAGYNPKIMNGVGVTNRHALISNEWETGVKTEVTGKDYGNYQWSLGKYYIEFTFKHPNSGEWIDGETSEKLNVEKIIYEWSIVREVKLLEKPYLNSDNSIFEYDGTEKTPLITNGTDAEGVVVGGDTIATAVGDYIIECKPHIPQKVTDVYDYRWSDNSVDVIPLLWHITKGTAQIPTLKLGTESFLYDGEPHIPVIENLDENKVVVTGYEKKTALGEYTITFSLKDPSSCTWTDGLVDIKTVTWHIVKQKFKKPTIIPDFMEYDGEEHTVEFVDNQKDHSFVVSGFDADTMNYSGDLKKTNVGKYEVVVSLKDTNSACWEDDSTDPVKLPWEIQKKTVLLDKPYVEPPFEYIFDGSWHTPVIKRYQTLGMYIKDGSVTSAIYHGDYTITFCLVEDNNITYLWGDEELNAVDGELEYAWKITKAVGENGVEKPVVTNLTFPYDKQYHSPTISEYDTALVSLDGTSRAWQNKTYTLTFSLKYPNDTEWEGGGNANVAYTWEIVKPVETVGKPKLEPVEFVYDAKEHRPEVRNLADVLQVVENVSQKDVGTHYVTVGFKSKANSGLADYTWEDGSTANISLPWKITKKTDLKKPDITPKKYTYDGTEHKPNTVDYDELFADYDGIKKATAAGKYTVTFSLKNPDFCTWEDGTVDDVECVWEIEKASFPKPEATVLKYLYNAQEHAPKITGLNEKVMSFSSDTTLSATSVGTYTIKISLNDTTSATWEDGTTDDVTYTWEIHKVKLTPPTVNKTEFTYNGGEHKPTISLFNPFLVEQSGTNVATNAGEYTITFSLIDPANYEWAVGGTENIDVKWKINKRQLDKPYIDPDSYPYTGREITAKIINFKDTAMVYRGGSVIKATLVGDYSATIGVNDNYEWTDGTMDDVVLDWHITKIFVPVPKIDKMLFPYNGSEQSPKITEYNPNYIKTDGILAATNAGDYEIKFSLKDKEHCEWETGGSKDIVYDWHITKIMLPKPVGIKTQFTYNGGYHLPVIENIKETLMSFKGSNREINAGTYKYTIILNDKENYIYEDNTVSDIDIVWTIGRKPVPVPFLDPTEFEYNGSSRSPVIKNFISDYMEIASGSRSSATEAGEYAISIALGKRVSTSPNSYYYLRNWEWDTENGGYGDITLTWRINKKALQYPTLLENEFAYDGKPHSPVKSGYSSRIMGIVGTDSEINAGDYKVGFYLKDTENYKWAEDVVPKKMLDWRILRAKLNKNDLPAQTPILVYNGRNQSPSWSSEYSPSKYTIGGDLNERNAGIYYALFSPSENYTWADGTTDEIPVPWNITKAGIKEPEQVNIPQYSGKEQSPQWDYDPTFVTIKLSGDISAVNAGEYIIDFKCDGNCYFLSTGTDICSAYWKIAKKPLVLPKVEQKYPYTGDIIIPQFKNYDPNVLEISGETEGVEVKDYTVYFEIKDNDNYVWDNSVFVNPKTKKAGLGWKIVRSALTASIPKQSNWLIYNGEKQSPAFWNYDTSLMLLIGDPPSKINAGIYNATFRLKFNVVWEDGTTGDKTVPWEIEKKKYSKPYIKTSETTGGMYYYEIEGKRYPVWSNYNPDVMVMSGDVYDIDGSWHITDFDFKDPDNYAWSDGESDRYSIRWKLSEPYDPTRVPGTRDKTVHIPRQIKPLYTDGTTKYPKWDRFDNTAIMKIGGVWEGVDAGTYYVILELRDGYVWEDGTYDIKAVPWKIFSVGEPKPKEPDPIVIHIPEQINIPYYDGWVKEPEWDIWDKFGIDVVKGDLYGVLAGGYPLVLRPQSGYVWENGTTKDKAVIWFINPRKEIEISDDDVPKNPLPEKGDDDNSGGDNCCCCCDTGLFDMLNNCNCDDGVECDCTKDVEI